MSKRIAFKTLGCRLNQYETDALRSRFVKNGYEIVNYETEADVYVINTCTVTHQSDSKSRNIIRQAKKRNGEAVVIVAGCMVDNYGEDLKEVLPEVAYFIDNEEKSSIYDRVEAHFKGTEFIPNRERLSLFDYEAAKETSHTRSMIKIQDGCDNFCTYCIIPHVRGVGTSRPLPDILKNIRKVLSFGYKEIVLTGVNIGRYQWEDIGFDELVEEVLSLPGDFRLRISSIEPEGFTHKLYQLFKHPKLTPHLHLCL
ncbi:MAG: tRNA (N(6)-L-threonylcarbamoyladenosine(37)-C(2))-methylthiotransferase MtaB, partial [Draconibacterium sp.]